MSDPKNSQKYNLIMNAATRIFSEKGYKAASMDEIAAAAPVSKATLYAHFKDKKNLFTAMLVDRCNNLSQIIDQVMVDPNLDFRTGLQKIAYQFQELTQSQESMCILSLVVAEKKQFSEIAEIFYTSVNLITGSLSKYLDAVAIRKEAHFKCTHLAAIMFVNMLKGDYFMKNLLGLPAQKSKQLQQELVDEAVHLFIQGHLPL
jgi:TetR/AcrR family transcriptional repressor of mexJK operon